MAVITESQPDVLFKQKKYGQLLAQTLPAVIHSAPECERALAEIDKLLRQGIRNMSPEEERLLELLSLLVAQYENETIVFPPSPPSRTLQFLLEQNDLQPADLASIFGSSQRVSEAVNGKRAISQAQAKALGEFFNTHVVEAFDCGIESLNHYLKNVAQQHQARNLSRVFVVTEENSLQVQGYYALSNCSVDASALPKPKKFKLPSSMAIPAILIGKLARDKTVRGKGLGGLLLFDALQRCVEVNARSAAYAVVLDAINDEAKAFYLQYEFQVMTGKDPYRLFLAMQHVVATLTQPGAE